MQIIPIFIGTDILHEHFIHLMTGTVRLNKHPTFKCKAMHLGDERVYMPKHCLKQRSAVVCRYLLKVQCNGLFRDGQGPVEAGRSKCPHGHWSVVWWPRAGLEVLTCRGIVPRLSPVYKVLGTLVNVPGGQGTHCLQSCVHCSCTVGRGIMAV